jgi:uncharacterized membrane protein YhaH (DUF805 family)
MVSLLFSPQGRIGAGPFWQGVALLLVIGIVLNALSIYGPPTAAMVLGIVGLLLIYPCLCVYAKRFHDAGKSAWWFLAVIGVYIVLIFIGSIALTAPMSADLARSMEGMTFGSPEFTAFQRDIARRTFLPSLLLSTAVWLAIAFFVSRLASDPAENRFGPPTTAALAA